MNFRTLDEWLQWQQGLHPRTIDLGLERVRTVWQRLAAPEPLPPVITVAGTNGKGSCAALLDSMLRAGDFRVGLYTSPHLLRYTERIRIDGREVEEGALCKTFARVAEARGDVSLTYFEFGTLAALTLFQEAHLDALVLEVGLGGRLDAVNIIDADVALITSVGIDHVDWLGPDRERIGAEKAGIFRTGRPAVIAEREPPASVVNHAAAVGATLFRAGRDFSADVVAGGWHWRGAGSVRRDLPAPALRGGVQIDNAAACLMVLHLLAPRLPLSGDAISRGLVDVRLCGRFQVVPGAVEWILDVAHNPDGVRVLADNLRAQGGEGRTWAVLGMVRGKDVCGVARILSGLVDGWYLAGLGAESERGLSAAELAAALQEAGAQAPMAEHDSVASACAAARAAAGAGDRIVVFGSFFTVAAALRDCV